MYIVGLSTYGKHALNVDPEYVGECAVHPLQQLLIEGDLAIFPPVLNLG